MQEVKRYIQHSPNYDKRPLVQVSDQSDDCTIGWEAICTRLHQHLQQGPHAKKILLVDCYQGVMHPEVLQTLKKAIQPDWLIDTRNLMRSETEIHSLIEPYMGDHPVFGYLSDLSLNAFMDADKFDEARKLVHSINMGTILVYGPGAALLVDQWDILVYADMARWEIQQRMRRNEVNNLGLNNSSDAVARQYKQGYFVDWRALDRHKQRYLDSWDYVLDTHQPGNPKLITGLSMRKGLQQAVRQPFRVVPFFDPGPWGGQWMREVCDLDASAINYAWCFDCVPEENSLLMGFGDRVLEIPSINLVFTHPTELLGEAVYKRFGAEFPIRFDFLDTMDGGNLSLQVHPLTKYIREKFGMSYTQDESYYMLEVEEDACVYLGFQEDIDPIAMIEALKAAQTGGPDFDAEKYVKKWPVKKHDHVLIPAGTVHCSGKNSMVLEISATPYIFTFKLWDWGRLGLDGKPRPISIDHGAANINWERTASWVEKELINPIIPITEGEGWREERTGLHELEFIETRRHWFTQPVTHHTQGNLNVLNLVQGREVIVESPDQAFEPFVVHYAETFIIPAALGAYTIRPYGESEGQECATIKAYVRV